MYIPPWQSCAGPMATVLVVGGGGREHAICTALAKSPKVETILVAPGNGGTGRGDSKLQNVVSASGVEDDSKRRAS